MPKFLTVAEVYEAIRRETPEDVYASSAEPSVFYTSADDYSVAKTIGTGYLTLQRVYDNYFPLYTVESIEDWEMFVFGRIGDGTLSLEQRRALVVQKLRQQGGITDFDIRAAVTGAIPFLAPSGFEVIPWNSPEGSWMLDLSQLGISTYLNGSNLVDAVGPGLCDADPADYGLTPEEWRIAQEEAYTYSVFIYNYTLTPTDFQTLDAALTAVEEGQSRHVIVDGLTDADRVYGDE